MTGERHSAAWNAGWRIGHQDGLQDSRERSPRLVADSRPQEDWHRGYLVGYPEGYDARDAACPGETTGVAPHRQKETLSELPLKSGPPAWKSWDGWNG